jgi:hypothetical protein
VPPAAIRSTEKLGAVMGYLICVNCVAELLVNNHTNLATLKIKGLHFGLHLAPSAIITNWKLEAQEPVTLGSVESCEKPAERNKDTE